MSLAAGIGLLFLVVALAGSGDVQFKLGDDVFEVGDAERFAERIETDGVPILFSSLSRGRPIYIQHVGDDATTGWTAFDARSPSDPDGCEEGLVYEVASARFVDACDPSATYPVDGGGLLQYDVSVNDDGKLVVDLNQDAAAS